MQECAHVQVLVCSERARAWKGMVTKDISSTQDSYLRTRHSGDHTVASHNPSLSQHHTVKNILLFYCYGLFFFAMSYHSVEKTEQKTPPSTLTGVYVK